ncbi:MAG: DUF3795 domain-containing protein [Methanomassiliicoccales archaeon]|nr:DUF3795 domain-containing protein [Methanomassiliicoccales archaeon]
MTEEDDLRLVTYCGLYCGACAQRVRVPDQAAALAKTLHEEGFDDFYQYVPSMKDDFPVFWRFLGSLRKFDCSCRDGKGGPPDCQIRECAEKRKMRVCPECDEYPCKNFTALAEHYPTLISDGRRMQKIGLERWIEEQKERAKCGFAYSDIRYK